MPTLTEAKSRRRRGRFENQLTTVVFYAAGVGAAPEMKTAKKWMMTVHWEQMDIYCRQQQQQQVQEEENDATEGQWT